MSTLRELRQVRLEKIQDLQKLGLSPYPAESYRTSYIQPVHDQFDALEGQEVVVAGRIVAMRGHGKVSFIDLKDQSGTVQLYLKQEQLNTADHSQNQLAYDDFNLLDLGDFIEAKGLVVKTKRGEISIDTTAVRLLTKSLRQMPNSWDGLKDKETRLRRRYLDTNINPDVYQRYIRRSKFWQAVRQYLLDNAFVEINIPVLEETAGGADANPFVTHMNALDQDFYLRISHELPLKRLLGGGYEKVFDIGPRFRNEGYTDEHLPEHVAMEWYWAYANWQDGMKLTQDMVRYIADQTWGTRQFTLANGHQIDLGPDGQDFPRISFVEIIKENFDLDVFTCTLEQAVEALHKHGGHADKIDNRSRVIDKLWKLVRGDIAGPIFLIDVPDFLQPLAKLQDKDPRLTEQFNLMLGGTEACKAYSELNDPVDQYNRFMEQQAMRDAGDDEAMMLDIDFIEMLEYGMPPACGYGHSERLFWLLEGVTAREGVPFPQMRHETDEVTKSIYPDLFPVTEDQNSNDQEDNHQQDPTRQQAD